MKSYIGLYLIMPCKERLMRSDQSYTGKQTDRHDVVSPRVETMFTQRQETISTTATQYRSRSAGRTDSHAAQPVTIVPSRPQSTTDPPRRRPDHQRRPDHCRSTSALSLQGASTWRSVGYRRPGSTVILDFIRH